MLRKYKDYVNFDKQNRKVLPGDRFFMNSKINKLNSVLQKRLGLEQHILGKHIKNSFKRVTKKALYIYFNLSLRVYPERPVRI